MAQRYQGGILGVGFNPLQAPNAPTIGTATPADSRVAVSFTAPANVGGNPITSYRVLANPGGLSGSGASSPVNVFGLTNGTAYTFSVSAVNSYGPSPYSGTVSSTPFLAIEDVFSTWLYTGNGSAQTITNGINLSGQGGMVWIKSRSAATNNFLFDTARGANVEINSNTTDANTTLASSLTSFSSFGFSVGSAAGINDNAATYASWTFREAPKFFDIVTYTGDGVSGRQIAHNLGVTPGLIIVKSTDNAIAWAVYHRSLGPTKYLVLNATDAEAVNPNYWNDTAPTSSNFTVAGTFPTNRSGYNYVAYLFAHDTDALGLIQCGSFTDSTSGVTVTLGWEPQWILWKSTTNAGNWGIVDTMRGMAVDVDAPLLRPNTSGVESVSGNSFFSPTATGFRTKQAVFNNGDNIIYIAIRRGPMRTPTLGTTVFSPVAYTASSGPYTINAGFAPDAALAFYRNLNSGNNGFFSDRLRGNDAYLLTPSTGAEGTVAGWASYTTNMSGIVVANGTSWTSGNNYIWWNFKRAPSFFDVVCYTGTGSTQTLNHNLGVVPELMIVKRRTGGTGVWPVYSGDATKALFLNETTAIGVSGAWNDTAPTATQFTISGASSAVGASGSTYVAYLFASCPSVSKVGSYTGTGALQTINCGFTTGARFVLIKRTDSTGDWYVWDSARGISSGNDPYLLLNSTAAEVTSTNYVDTTSVGFQVTAAAPAGINANGGSYIFLAIS